MKIRVFVNFTENYILTTYEKKIDKNASKKVIQKLREKFKKNIILTPRVVKPFKVLTINIVEEA